MRCLLAIAVGTLVLSSCGKPNADKSDTEQQNSSPQAVPSTQAPPIQETEPSFPPQAIVPPDHPEEQALGYYSKGSLVQSSEMDLAGDGFVKIFRPRLRQFGSAELIHIITTAAAKIQEEYPEGERIQIGDLSQRHGGRISRHRSHQNGLDIDLSYYRRDHREQKPYTSEGFDEYFVYRNKVTSNFDFTRNWKFFHAIVQSGKIQRIFVDPVIKTALCEYAASQYKAIPGDVLETLRRLRGIPNHKNHSHVRIKCPKNSDQCIEQPEPPVEYGCELSELAS